MTTEFEISSRIVCWGDNLEPFQMVKILGLDPHFCTLRYKGEELKRKNGSPAGSIAKTGMLTYTYDRQFPESKRDPEKQLEFVTSMLMKLPHTLYDKYEVEVAELQISLYYKNKLPGDVEFLIPEPLLKELCRHRIQIRVTVLP